jgi:serine/threonine-protein kinase
VPDSNAYCQIDFQELTLGKKFAESYVTQLLVDILEVLEFVHQQGVIHRDIKPSNLMRRQGDGKIVLIDFGAVKELSAPTIGAEGPSTSRTIAIGTPGYTPNEQMAGKPRLSSDVYAVGMIGVQALTGLFPKDLPEDPNTDEILWHSLTTVSLPLRSVLDHMILADYRQRYQTAAEALQALRQKDTQIAPQITPAPLVAPTQTPVPPIPNLVAAAETVQQITPAPAPRKGSWVNKLLLGLVLVLLGTVGGIFAVLYFQSRLAPNNSASAPSQPTAMPTAESTATPEATPTAEAPATAQPEATPTASATAVPVASVKPDFTQLKNMLTAGQWKTADQETSSVMQSIAGKTGQTLGIEDIEQFPCQDLVTINQLWVQASKGQFGFSTQQRLWQSLAGKPGTETFAAYKSFSNQVGWTIQYSWGEVGWKKYPDLTFAANAPIGHLPVGIYFGQDGLRGDPIKMPTVAQRIAFCSAQKS